MNGSSATGRRRPLEDKPLRCAPSIHCLVQKRATSGVGRTVKFGSGGNGGQIRRLSCIGRETDKSPTVSKPEPIVAIALLTRPNLRMLKDSLPKVFPIPDDGSFDALLLALDGSPEGKRRSVKAG